MWRESSVPHSSRLMTQRENRMFVLDSHCDTPSQIFRHDLNLAIDNENVHVDFPKLRRGGVDGAFFALYIPAEMDSDADVAFAYSKELLHAVERTVEANPDKAAFAVSARQASENQAEGLFSVFLGLENGSPIGSSLERLEWFHKAGIRYVTLCHTGNNLICDSCATVEKRWNGLSPFGREVVAEMNRLGMLVDVSHISDKAFFDVLECSSRPVVATHSCCRALADHPRNMTDEMIRVLAAAGGVIQINFYPVFLDSSYETVNPSCGGIADHIDHVVELAGIDHVGLGSDYDGIEITPEGMEDISGFHKVLDELSLRGYSESDICKIASGNFFRIL